MMPHRQPVLPGMQRHEVEPQPPVPVPFAQPVRAPGAQQVGTLAPSHALLGQAPAAVGAITHFNNNHPAGILRNEVDLPGTLAHVVSKDAETAQAKEGGREILGGAPAFLARNNPAHRRRGAGASGINGNQPVGKRTHAPFPSTNRAAAIAGVSFLARLSDYSAAGASGAEAVTTGAGAGATAAFVAFTRPFPFPTGPTVRRSLIRADFPLSLER